MTIGFESTLELKKDLALKDYLAETLELVRLPMTTSYNQIAGQSVERLAALSDGIFAVAMTLLVLDLRVPAQEAIHSEHDLWRALVALSPRLVMYLMSFLTLGIFWIGQQTQLTYLARSDRSLSWIHILFLFAVSITPFSTMLLMSSPPTVWRCLNTG
jgi:uncharacterized membrane protein